MELSVDAILLSDLTEPIRAERFHKSTEILRYLAAKKLVAFYDKRPDLPFPPDSGPQRQLVDTPGLEARLDALSQRLWNLPLNKAPTHWTKQDLSARCASVGDDFTLIYQHEVAILNWHVHAGGAGVGGIPVEGFKLMEVLARRIITKAVPKAYRAIGAAFGLDQKVQNFGRRLEILEGYASLAGIDARLRAVGHPGNLAPLGRLK